MRENIAILLAGTGKMSRNIGRFFLAKGSRVTWLSRDPARLAALRTQLAGFIARISKEKGPESFSELTPLPSPAAAFHLYEDADIPKPDIIIECINESLPEKQDVLARLRRVTTENTLVLSNSSSLLPDDIAPGCIGVHFFYPVELTGLAEVIFPDSSPRGVRERVTAFLQAHGIAPIVQTRAAAFAVNRLLLPLHAECFRLLADGWPAGVVDECSKSRLLPGGALSFMDSVGIDILDASARNYISRMPADEQADYAVLAEGLAELLRQNRLGRKNGRGIVLDPRKGLNPEPSAARVSEARRTLLYLFINACYNSLYQGKMTGDALALALRSLFQSERPLEEVARAEGGGKIRSHLDRLHAETGISYFRCAPGLKDQP